MKMVFQVDNRADATFSCPSPSNLLRKAANSSNQVMTATFYVMGTKAWLSRSVLGTVALFQENKWCKGSDRFLVE